MITFSTLKHHELFQIQSDIKIICDLKKNDYLISFLRKKSKKYYIIKDYLKIFTKIFKN